MRPLFFILSFSVFYPALAFEYEEAATAEPRDFPRAAVASVGARPRHPDIASLQSDILHKKLNQILGEGHRAEGPLGNLEIMSTDPAIKTKCIPPGTEQEEAETASFQVIETVPENEQPEVIFGVDNRQQVFHTQQWPFCAHGVVTVDLEKNTETLLSQGTGVLIAPRVVLTAAHVLHPKGWTAAKVMKVAFYPARNGEKNPYDFSPAQKWYFPEEYKENKQEDYAIVITTRKFDTKTGYLGLEVLPDEHFEKDPNSEYSLYGYPGDKQPAKGMHLMFGTSGTINAIDQENLRYTISTTPGQSGAPLFHPIAIPGEQAPPKDQRNGDPYHVVGVHVSGKDALSNRATRLTEARFKQIQEWIQDAITQEKKSLKTLTELRLPGGKGGAFDGNKLNDAAIQELLNLSLPKLETLDLTDHFIEKAAESLSKLPNLEALRVLKLGTNRLGETAEEHNAIPLLCSLENLHSLDLGNCRLTANDARQLAQGTLPALQELYIGKSKDRKEREEIGPEGAQALAEAKWAPQIVTLEVQGNGIGDDGAKALVENMPQLKSLNVARNNLTSQSIKGVCSLSSLETLEISLNETYLRRYSTFRGLFKMGSLTTLSLELCHEKGEWVGTNLAVIDAVTKMLNHSKIERFYLEVPEDEESLGKTLLYGNGSRGLPGIGFEPEDEWFVRKQTAAQQ